MTMKGIPADLSAILTLEKNLSRAWNTHDMKAMANLLTKDADFITVGGTWLHGRDEFRRHHETLHDTMFKNSTMRIISTDVRFIRPDLALAHVKWKISGDFNPDGTRREPRTGIFTQVLLRARGQWRIFASQNTNEAPMTGKALTASLKRREWK